MKKISIYLDNAATTPLLPEVCARIVETFDQFGNPSSVHRLGREAKAIIEKARRNIAGHLKIGPSQLFFTSGATESINMGIFCTFRSFPNMKTIITSKLEHEAVLASAKQASKIFSKKLIYVNTLLDGHIDLEHLKKMLQQNPNSLVCLMYANNEIGNISGVEEIGKMCVENDCIYFCDTVQGIAHYPLDLGTLPIHMTCCSSHKFHGPKGVGFLVVKDLKICSRSFGGGQEMNFRAGTENILGIAGMDCALELALKNLDKDTRHIKYLKERLIKNLQNRLGDKIDFYGDFKNGLFSVLNLKLPTSVDPDIMVYRLDIEGICVSSGSACTSGSNKYSHVIEELNRNSSSDFLSLRVSFSKLNTGEEIDIFSEKVVELFLKFV